MKTTTKSFFKTFKETITEMGNPKQVSSYEINYKLKEKGVADSFFKSGHTAVCFRRLGYENEQYRGKTWLLKDKKNKEPEKNTKVIEPSKSKSGWLINLFFGLIKIEKK